MLKHESNLILYFLNLNDLKNLILIFDSKFKFVDIEQHEIDDENVNFKFFDVDLTNLFATKTTFD